MNTAVLTPPSPRFLRIDGLLYGHPVEPKVCANIVLKNGIKTIIVLRKPSYMH
jgi:hypothetical protein